ncbi:mitochondrial protein PET191 [Candidozyma duobushaemuli]|uniref:Mitochondrial protein PET191 n=2 Tax=Candidozyma TaxID=3303203 RepID=A0ABX8I051_9ASCO|nr:mitochondrial protein PET191 [[Candida] duobushaemulonis]PVH17768.1 mitochondrial protein PET191 [[Candida] duobushaemulonis]QWU86372.1 hypothetical protein CA3LBN_000590 [[Candida] haemuloni]
MGASCKDQKKALAICLQRSPCVLIQRHSPKECLTDPELRKDLPELCAANFRAFIECKNGFFDMRKRMRGNAPLSTGKYDDTYEKLSSGDFDPREEMRKLERLNKNLARSREAKEDSLQES